MSRDTRYVIAPADVVAIRLECGRCKRVVIEPVKEDDLADSDFTNCPVCKTVWKFHGQGDAISAMRDLRRTLHSLASRSVPTAISISLEINLGERAHRESVVS